MRQKKDLFKKLSFLIDLGSEINEEQLTQLQVCAQQAQGLNMINYQGFKERTCLHNACSHYNPNLITIYILITNGANLNIKDQYGDTPLQLAIFERNTAVILFLMMQQADMKNIKIDCLHRATNNLFQALEETPLTKLMKQLQCLTDEKKQQLTNIIQEKLINEFSLSQDTVFLDNSIRDKMATFLMAMTRYKNTALKGKLFCPPKFIQLQILKNYLQQDQQAKLAVICIVLLKMSTEQIQTLMTDAIDTLNNNLNQALDSNILKRKK